MSVIFSSGGKELRDTKITGLILTEWADTERRLSLAMWSTVEGIGIFGCRFFGGRNSVWLAYRQTTPLIGWLLSRDYTPSAANRNCPEATLMALHRCCTRNR
jgi:hypothetical protein